MTSNLRDWKMAKIKEEEVIEKPVKAHDHSHDNVWHFDEEYRAISQMFDNRFIISLQNEAENGDSYADLKKKMIQS